MFSFVFKFILNFRIRRKYSSCYYKFRYCTKKGYNEFNPGESGCVSSYFFHCSSVFAGKSISIQIVVVLNLMTRFKEKYNNGIKQGNEKKTTSFFFFFRFQHPAGSISSQITITLSP